MLDYSVEATYYRTALFLGLIPGDAVHRWAERVIARDPEPPPALFDVVSVPSGDLSALRIALWPLVVEPEPLPVLRAMLALLHADVVSGRRRVGDTVTVLRQMRSMLRLPAALYAELNMVLVEESSGKPSVLEWLPRFAEEHLALAPGPG